MSANPRMPAAFSGPVEEHTWPEQLTARVVEPGPSPRVHGYEVESDLALHYGTADLVLLALTGELPPAGVARAFEVATAFLAPIAICEAPTHAAYLARLSGSVTSGIVSVAGIALAEQSRVALEDHAPWLAWLAAGAQGDVPSAFAARDGVDRTAVDRLRTALGPTKLVVPGLSADPTRLAALIAVLRACGLTKPAQIEAAMVSARMPVALAEAFAVRPTAFNEYPMDLPPFRYEESA